LWFDWDHAQMLRALNKLFCDIDSSCNLVKGLANLGMIPVEPQSGSNDVLEQISEYFGADDSRTQDGEIASDSVDHFADLSPSGK